MRPLNLLIPAALASLITTSAHSEESERYRLEKSAGGYVRMDTKTGAMSTCEETKGQLVCRMAADEHAAYEDEIDRLQASIKALDERVTRLENSLAARLESTLPSEEDFTKTMSYMERFLRGFMDIVKDLNKDDGAPAKPDPQKT